jgi:hypothetical protein
MSMSPFLATKCPKTSSKPSPLRRSVGFPDGARRTLSLTPQLPTDDRADARPDRRRFCGVRGGLTGLLARTVAGSGNLLCRAWGREDSCSTNFCFGD